MKIYFIIISILLNAISHAQEYSGQVLGENEIGITEPLPGAIVFWKGTTIGTSTDSVGIFHISNPDKTPAILIVNMMGFLSDTVIIKTESTEPIKVVLKSTTITIKELEVTAIQKSSLYSSYSPINTEIINQKELLKAACCNLSESFSSNASVDVTFSDAVSGAKQIQMLGLSGIYTQILSENMPMLRGLSSAYGLNYIPGTWIESISVTKGAGSVVNGYESISGQINLEFLKPELQKERFFINVYGNQKGRAEANVHYAAKVNEKWSSLTFLHASGMTLKNDINDDSFLDMPQTQQYNLFNRWKYNGKKGIRAQFGIKALYEKRQGGQINFDYDKDYGTTNAYGIGINTSAVEYFSKTAYLFPSKPYESIGLQTSGKIHQQDMFFGLREYSGDENNWYANLIYANIIRNTNHKYKIGLSYLYDDYNERYNDSVFKRSESVPGVFAEYTYSWKEKFSAVAGGRADMHNIYGMQYTPRLHLRYNPTKSTTLRASGGKGFRVSNIFVENQQVFASSRRVIIPETLNPEIAWNYGASINQKLRLFNKKASINVDFFRTDFQNQIVVDLDNHVNEISFYNLDGQSYSNSFQTDFDIIPFKSFDVKIAYKWYEVKTTYQKQLLDKPYVVKDRILLNLAYATYMDIWKFSFTTNWMGISRLPNTSKSPAEYQLPARSKDYFLLDAQVTKKFKKFETYLGVENLLNYTQENPIVAADKPFGANFDASMIYAPINGRIIYAGLRMKIK